MACALPINRLCLSSSTDIFLLLRPVCSGRPERRPSCCRAPIPPPYRRPWKRRHCAGDIRLTWTGRSFPVWAVFKRRGPPRISSPHSRKPGQIAGAPARIEIRAFALALSKRNMRILRSMVQSLEGDPRHPGPSRPDGRTHPARPPQDLFARIGRGGLRAPYCRIADLVSAGIAKRQTAVSYLKALVDHDLLTEVRAGRENLYINPPLIELLSERRSG